MMRSWRPDWPIDLALVLGTLPRGQTDPVCRQLGRQQFWLTGGTPLGPGSLQVQRRGSDIVGEAWGPGAQWFLQRMPLLLGDNDDPGGFQPAGGTVIAQQWRRHGHHWRVPASGLVRESAILAVLEQKVTGIESRRAWYQLCRDFGEPAPGPAPARMHVVPDRQTLISIPSWWWRRAGVDHHRAATLIRVARQGLAPDDPDDARRRLAAIPGIGPWSLAEIGCRAFGDPDAVSIGDFHLANVIGYALTGRPRSTDDQLLELLAPFAGHRYRAVRMIELSGVKPPRYGPRATLPTHR